MCQCYHGVLWITDNTVRPLFSLSQSWVAVLALAFSAFIFNTTEFVPVGMLTDIGKSFDMPVEQVGLMLTIYAWFVALSSLPLLLIFNKVERRRLLTWVFVIFIVSHLISGIATNFTILMIGRLGVATAHAIFWSITAALTVRIAPDGKRSLALGLLATGTSVAMVLGIPLGRIVGNMLGWRVTFIAIGIMAAIALALLLKSLPTLPSQNSGSFKSLPTLLRRPALLSMYLLIALIVTANFTAYSYIEPFIEQVGKLSVETTTNVLLLFGAAGILGSFLFGKLNERFPEGFLLGILGTLSVCLLLLLPALQSTTVLYGIAIVWGVTFIGYTLAIQYKVMAIAPDARDIAMSMFSGIYNIGIGAGALIGSQISIHAGMQHIGLIGGIIGIIATLWCVFAFIKMPELRHLKKL